MAVSLNPGHISPLAASTMEDFKLETSKKNPKPYPKYIFKIQIEPKMK